MRNSPNPRRRRDRQPDPDSRYELAHRAMWAWLASGAMPELEQSDAQLLLATSTRVPDGKTVTDPALHEEYLEVMRCHRSTLKRASDRLTGLKRLVRLEGGQGSKYLRYELPDLAAPLLVAAGARSLDAVLRREGTIPASGPDQTSSNLHEVGRSPDDQTSRNLREVRPGRDGDTFLPRSEEGGAAPQPRLPDADVRHEARRCYERFVVAFAQHRGELYLGDDDDIEIVSELLFSGLTPAALETYASVILTLTPVAGHKGHCQCDRCWIANGDRNIRVLRWCLLRRPKLKRFLDRVNQPGRDVAHAIDEGRPARGSMRGMKTAGNLEAFRSFIQGGKP